MIYLSDDKQYFREEIGFLREDLIEYEYIIKYINFL